MPLRVRTQPHSSCSSSRSVRGWWSPQNHQCFTEFFVRLPPQRRLLFDVRMLPEEYGRVAQFDSGYVCMRHLKDFTHVPARPSNKPEDKHNLFIHFLTGPYCDVCRRTEITRAQCRRSTESRYDRIPQARTFGDTITVDHQALNGENGSRLQHGYAVAVQYFATQWIRSWFTVNIVLFPSFHLFTPSLAPWTPHNFQRIRALTGMKTRHVLLSLSRTSSRPASVKFPFKGVGDVLCWTHCAGYCEHRRGGDSLAGALCVESFISVWKGVRSADSGVRLSEQNQGGLHTSRLFEQSRGGKFLSFRPPGLC